jgi:hypothetical protein
MSGVPVNVAVFFGKVDKRPEGWYWTAGMDTKKSIAGPFDTKTEAAEDAVRARGSETGGQHDQ